MPDETPMPLKLLWALRDDRSLSAVEQRVLVMLIAHADAKGVARPSVGTLASEARTSKGAVRRALAAVESGRGPIRLNVDRGRLSDRGDALPHTYGLSLGVGSPRPQGWDHPDPRRRT